jgi:hypothetical protein
LSGKTRRFDTGLTQVSSRIENKEMFFPTTIKFFPTPRDVSVVKEGWVWKGVSGVKGGDFKKSQRDFLLTLFNNNGGSKIRERDTHMRMSDRERIHRVQSIYPG